jgi:hypothetical protein
MKAISAYARDVWEARKYLIDHGFKIASDLLGDMSKPQAEAIGGAFFSIYEHRINWRGDKGEMSLWQKIRAIELNMTIEEFTQAVAQFHGKDRCEQDKAWYQKLDEWVKSQLKPEHYELYRHGSGGWDFEARFQRQCPRPRPQTIKADNIAWIENQRPHREGYNPVLIEIFERYFEQATGYRLTWEQLHSKLENRDPRAKLTPEAEKKRNKKNRKREEAVSSVPVEEPAQIAMEA